MSQKNKGVCCILLSSFSFALMNLFVHLSGDLPSVQKSFFRNFVAMLFALFILLKERPTIRLDGASKKYLFLRSFCGTVGILCNFYAVDHLVLADASMHPYLKGKNQSLSGTLCGCRFYRYAVRHQAYPL